MNDEHMEIAHTKKYTAVKDNADNLIRVVVGEMKVFLFEIECSGSSEGKWIHKDKIHLTDKEFINMIEKKR